MCAGWHLGVFRVFLSFFLLLQRRGKRRGQPRSRSKQKNAKKKELDWTVSPAAAGLPLFSWTHPSGHIWRRARTLTSELWGGDGDTIHNPIQSNPRRVHSCARPPDRPPARLHSFIHPSNLCQPTNRSPAALRCAATSVSCRAHKQNPPSLSPSPRRSRTPNPNTPPSLPPSRSRRGAAEEQTQRTTAPARPPAPRVVCVVYGCVV